MNGVWGKKVGMTQIFLESEVVPVTAIDVSNWIILDIKTKEGVGYDALQVGLIKDKYLVEDFSTDWIKEPKKYFANIREIRGPLLEGVKVGDSVDLSKALEEKDKVDVAGISIGRGFQGVVKRYNFSGGRASHGDKMGRAPGAIGFLRKQGRVFKGQRLPGHMGFKCCSVENLEVVKLEPENNFVFIKGAVPGKAGSLVFIRKANRG